MASPWITWPKSSRSSVPHPRSRPMPRPKAKKATPKKKKVAKLPPIKTTPFWVVCNGSTVYVHTQEPKFNTEYQEWTSDSDMNDSYCVEGFSDITGFHLGAADL